MNAAVEDGLAVGKSGEVARTKQGPRFSRHFWPYFWTVVVLGILAIGYFSNLDLYLTPQRGLGYWLGITGGSMMVLLLLYSARKRVSWLRWMGRVPFWFDFHMILGVAGPVLVLFHSNFRLGATNSNVALWSMLLVAGSGVVGRYIYTRLHQNLDGREETLEDLRAVADRTRAQTTQTPFLPGLMDMIEREEKRVLKPANNALSRLLVLVLAGPRSFVARWRVRKLIHSAVERAVNHESELVRRQAGRIAKVAKMYAYRRLDAARRVAEYQTYTKLFSLWHILHLPLFFMLLIAGIVHVVAVNIY